MMHLNLAYVGLISLQVPFHVAYLLFTLFHGAEPVWGILTLFYVLLTLFFFVTLVVLGTGSITCALQSQRRGELDACLRGMMVLKYGMIPHFILHFLTISLLLFFSIVASRGTILLAPPIFLGAVLLALCSTWIPMLPGAIWGVQVVRLSGDRGLWKPLHYLLQFCFVLDVLETVYLTVCKYHRGKLAAGIVLGVYTLCAAGALLLWHWLFP